MRRKKIEKENRKRKSVSGPHYEFYQEAKFSDGKQMIKSISCTEKSLHTVDKRIESLNRNNTPWKLYMNKTLIKESQPKIPKKP